MNIKERNLLKSNIKEYYQILFPNIKANEKDLIKCPLNCSSDLTAHFVSHQLKCYNPKCKGVGDIFDLAKLIRPSLRELSDSDIGEIIKHKLHIEFVDDTDDLIKRYEDAGFALIPLSSMNPQDAQQGKRPIESAWQNSVHKNPVVWKGWIDKGYNVGLNLGKVSNVVAVDIDDEPTHEKVRHLLGDTLVQKTGNGWHYLYNYDPAFVKTLNKVIRDSGYEMELRTDKSYIVIAPSIAYEGDSRTWNNGKIIDMPSALKDFFMPYYKNEQLPNNPEAEIQHAIDEEVVPLADLSSKRNDTFVKLGGILRKKLNIANTEYVLNIISNNLIDKPIEQRELRAILNQIKKYNTYDKVDLAKQVLDRLDIIGEGSAFQISKSLNLEQKDVEDALKYLLDQEEVISLGKRGFKKLTKVEWETDFRDITTPITFELPYFHDLGYFDDSNMIVIGARTGNGKTHVAANIIKKLVDQGIKPYLISTEAGSKIGKICNELNIQPGDFKYKIVKNPTNIEFADNAVTIIDWLKPDGSDYARTDATFEKLNDQLVKHKGFLIVFVQIRKSDGEFFASDQVDFYSALTATYNFKRNGDKLDMENTYFQTSKIRDSKSGFQVLTVPMKFDRVTKRLERAND